MYAAARTSTPPPPADEEARISIPGIASKVVAKVDRRTDRGVTLTRELPLLRVGTAIEGEGGRVGKIEGVWISMEGDVPALCVELSYEDERPRNGRPPAVRADETIGYERASIRALAAIPEATAHGSGKRVRRPRPDDTNRHATLAYDDTELADTGPGDEPTCDVELERPAAAPVVIRRSLWDRMLDLFDAIADKWRALLGTGRPRLSH